MTLREIIPKIGNNIGEGASKNQWGFEIT